MGTPSVLYEVESHTSNHLSSKPNFKIVVNLFTLAANTTQKRVSERCQCSLSKIPFVKMPENVPLDKEDALVE